MHFMQVSLFSGSAQSPDIPSLRTPNHGMPWLPNITFPPYQCAPETAAVSACTPTESPACHASYGRDIDLTGATLGYGGSSATRGSRAASGA